MSVASHKTETLKQKTDASSLWWQFNFQTVLLQTRDLRAQENSGFLLVGFESYLPTSIKSETNLYFY